MLRSLQYFIQIAIFLAFLSTIKAQNAKFGETEVRVTIKTGSYPKEQRWTLYRLTNITSRQKETSDSCPGWIDGGDPTDWSVRSLGSLGSDSENPYNDSDDHNDDDDSDKEEQLHLVI